METYHKINSIFKRHMDGKKKGKLIKGDWSQPEFEYLANNEWEFTEKVDGTNIRVHLSRSDDNLVVSYFGRTPKAAIPMPLLEHLEATFPTYPMWRRSLMSPSYSDRNKELFDWMVDNDLDSVMLFGEGYGPKIQSGGKYRDDHSFVLFDVKVGQWWLRRHAVNGIASKLGIESVPVIGTGTLHDAVDIVSTGLTFNKQGAVVRWGGAGINGLKSQWGNFEAEGIVARPKVDMFDRMGNRIITKIKGVDFK